MILRAADILVDDVAGTCCLKNATWWWQWKKNINDSVNFSRIPNDWRRCSTSSVNTIVLLLVDICKMHSDSSET